jgi:hypothetical protein
LSLKIPPFKFALSPDEPELTPKSGLWSNPLPASRHGSGQTQGDRLSDEAVTYGDYFTAVQHFLSQDDLSPVRRAAGELAGKTVSPADIDHIGVYLIKHGAFYHPAYAVATVGGGPLPFVINVAVSPAGRMIIDQEYHNLSKLNCELSDACWPRVFHKGRGEDLHGRPIPMFLGQWFDGFYEFHLTGESPAGRSVKVWDPQRGHHTLSRGQVESCLQKAAFILTYAYNPLTFEAIGHWHHAAGDFVIALEADKVDLRLITVRRYAPMIENPQPDVASMLEALLLFLVKISLKLRLDRLDGVGPMACHCDDVVAAVSRGFFQGLGAASPVRGLPEDFDATVKEYAALHSADQLTAIAMTVMEKAPFNSKERDLINGFLGRHITALARAIAT